LKVIRHVLQHHHLVWLKSRTYHSGDVGVTYVTYESVVLAACWSWKQEPSP